MMTSTPQPKTETAPYLPLTPAEIGQLKAQGCYCREWNRVSRRDGSDMRLIRSCRFVGDVKIGRLDSDSDSEQGIFNAVIHNCTIGDNVFISGVAGRLDGLVIDDCVRIENVGRIIAEPGADFGVGTPVSVLDETGSRPVYIYPGLSAQIASLMAHRPHWTEDNFLPMLDTLRGTLPEAPTIGRGAEVMDTRYIFDVRIGPGVRVHGASYLKNGTILSNAASGHQLTFVGNDVDAEDFIVEDGRVDSGTLLRRCYVGQGVELEKRFTAHDSLFFANCSMENGEACAILAGPYTVSMHKASLLIGGEYSFFNAGSATNSSNHKYKLGPVHWGVMQRGVKTASGAYIMWGGKIGAFSLLMGAHKTHPDTSAFPFSYLFGEPDGGTLAIPGLMLKSCGLMRDELKWPKRDRRVKGRVPLHDRINFEVLNPITAGAMLRALPLIDELEKATPDSRGIITHEGVRLRARDLARARDFYLMAIGKYFTAKMQADPHGIARPATTPIIWKDLGGQIITDTTLEAAMQAESIEQLERILHEAHEDFPRLEREWITQMLTPQLRLQLTGATNAADRLNALVEQDRKQYLTTLSRHNNTFSL